MAFRSPRYGFASLLAALILSALFVAGREAPQPYATLDRNAVTYAGPGRETAHDLTGPEVRIGLVTPLAGPRKAEGAALLAAAQLALEDEAAPLRDGRRIVLVARDESGPWGRVSSEIVRLVVDERAVAVITSADGGAAHLAEQVANKIGVPVVTLSSDTTTTEINLPWIFRLGPTDAAQARAFARSIYLEHGFKRVLLVTERDHDGRVGGEEFERAAGEAGGTAQRLVFDGAQPDADTFTKENAAADAEAIVLWTGPEAAGRLVQVFRESSPDTPIYLCRKAAQDPFWQMIDATCRSCDTGKASETGRVQRGLWVAAPPRGEASEARRSFERRYHERTGKSPGNAVLETYDAVRLLAANLRETGANRARLRDRLAKLSNYTGISGTVSFDPAGNDLSPVSLVAAH